METLPSTSMGHHRSINILVSPTIQAKRIFKSPDKSSMNHVVGLTKQKIRMPRASPSPTGMHCINRLKAIHHCFSWTQWNSSRLTHSLTRALNETTLSCSTFHYLAGDMEVASIPVTPDPYSFSKSTKANKNKHRDGCSHPRLNKFVRRLHDMLVQEKHSGIVEWRRGLLVLFSADAFSKRILPKYFNTRNFKTFRRQVRRNTTRRVASAIYRMWPGRSCSFSY